MVHLTINSISVDFPYQPYPAQIRYMSRVIDALRSGQNALLESPTGTGKTLCLLCAALGWRATYIAALQAHTLPNNNSQKGNAQAELLLHAGLRPMQGAGSALATVIQPHSNPQLAAPRIVFSSRTHSQLSQAVVELKKTEYNPSMSILASRDQLCIHDIATNLSGSRLNAMCRRITATSRRQCRFHLPVASARAYENRAPELIDKLYAQPAMDIEDLRAFGGREGACPFFLSRAAARSDACEILFLPYNYLLDRAARNALDIDWANDIIIIDEAHNLEGICSDSMSFDFTMSMRNACDSELSKLIEKGLRPGGLSIPALAKMASSETGVDSVLGSENRDLLEIRLMRSIVAALEEFVRNADLDRGKNGDVAFKVFPGNQVRKVMERAGGPTLETYELFLEMLDRAMDMQAESVKLNDSANPTSADGASSSSGNSAIRVLQTALRVLFESLADGNERCFRTVVQQSASRPAAGRTLSYWCFKPSIAMKAMKILNMRCLLLTSGTLSPLDSFATELGLSFPVRLENPHVITQRQVWAGVVRSGPDVGSRKGGRLTSAYFARGEDSNVELGRSIIRFATTIPDGLLVFYPSYASLYSCVDVWKRVGPGIDRSRPSIWEHLLRWKRIVMEERDSSKVSAAVLAHRANVDSGHGSILLAVCRGKVSEGIDFSDEYGRAVVITGLPYPSAMDPKVVLKREYADEEAKRLRAQNAGNQMNDGTDKILNGAQWYTVQALRAVNQAAGRAIRHRFDYGAILLCDERFQSVPLQGQISKWLRPSVKVHSTFDIAEVSLQQFFANAVTSEFAKEGEQRRLEAKKRHKETSDRRRTLQEEDTNAVVLAQGAIDRLLPPPKTEAQFVNQMVAISDEIKAENPKLGSALSGHNQSQGAIDASVVIQLSSQGARGGMLDSGSMPSMTNGQAAIGVSTLKRSAMFLAARAERDKGDEMKGHAEGEAAKRLKRTLSANGNQNLGTNRKSRPQEKMSEKIKNMFEKGDVRPFLDLFRQLLGVNSRIVDGVGPLQTESDVSELRQKGQEKVKQIVKFTREKASSSESTPSPEAFLQELKAKIPATFQQCYEEALKG